MAAVMPPVQVLSQQHKKLPEDVARLINHFAAFKPTPVCQILRDAGIVRIDRPIHALTGEWSLDYQPMRRSAYDDLPLCKGCGDQDVWDDEIVVRWSGNRFTGRVKRVVFGRNVRCDHCRMMAQAEQAYEAAEAFARFDDMADEMDSSDSD